MRIRWYARWFWWLLSLSLFAVALPVHADEDVVIPLNWNVTTDPPSLTLAVAQHLSKRQKTLINSGFSTYSALVVRAITADAPELLRHECTVKFDTWEERYDLVLLSDSPESKRVKEFHEYADKCLTVVLSQRDKLAERTRQGGTLAVTLNLEQISGEQAAKAKQWLVRQQTGVMQGLFAHMIGELTLTEALSFRVQFPPRPTQATATPPDRGAP